MSYWKHPIVRAGSVMGITPHQLYRFPSLAAADRLSKTISARPIPHGHRVVVDLRALRYFVAVAEERHVGRAASRLHMTQPPPSRAIRQLEDELGTTLFERTRRESPSRPPDGDVRRNGRITAASRPDPQSRDRVAGAATLTIGTLADAAEQAGGRLVPPFRARHPHVNVSIHESDLSEPTAGLRAGLVDVALTRTPLRRHRHQHERVPEREPSQMGTAAQTPTRPSSPPFAHRQKKALSRPAVARRVANNPLAEADFGYGANTRPSQRLKAGGRTGLARTSDHGRTATGERRMRCDARMARVMYTIFGWMRAHQTPEDAEALTALLNEYPQVPQQTRLDSPVDHPEGAFVPTLRGEHRGRHVDPGPPKAAEPRSVPDPTARLPRAPRRRR